MEKTDIHVILNPHAAELNDVGLGHLTTSELKKALQLVGGLTDNYFINQTNLRNLLQLSILPTPFLYHR